MSTEILTGAADFNWESYEKGENISGLSQEQLAEKANVSRSHISSIEAPGIVRPFSLEVFFNLADALEVDPADLINASVLPDRLLNNKKSQ